MQSLFASALFLAAVATTGTIAAPSARVEPATVVACRRLLTRPVQSPLYNPNLPDEDLAALVFRIRAGINSPDRSVGPTRRPVSSG